MFLRSVVCLLLYPGESGLERRDRKKTSPRESCSKAELKYGIKSK